MDGPHSNLFDLLLFINVQGELIKVKKSKKRKEKMMGIQRIMAKAVSYVAKSGKTAAKAVSAGAKAKTPSILSKVETNTAGRILKMQDAKRAFTPVAPYATKVTKESVPTLQKIEEITGVARGAVKDSTGYFNKQAAADALAAFKHEPVKLKGGKLGVTSVPTQQYLDNMHNIAKIDALKNYEEGGRATRAILDRRAAAREAFTNGGGITSRYSLGNCKYISKDGLLKGNFKEQNLSKFRIKSFNISPYGQKKMKISEWKDAIDKNAFTELLKKG